MGCCCCSVGKSCLTLWPHGLQHASLPCPSLSPWVCSNSCPLSQWCYLIISSSAALFSFCLQSFTASGSLPVSQLLASGGQSTGASGLAPDLPMDFQGWFPLGMTGLISLQSRGLSTTFSSTTIWKYQFFDTEPSLWRRRWHPTQVLLPGKFHGRRSLVGCSPWGREESDTTERLHFHFSLSCIGEGNGNLLQCSCLENPRDGGAWWAAV